MFDTDKLTAFNGERIRDLDPSTSSPTGWCRTSTAPDGETPWSRIAMLPAHRRRARDRALARPARAGAHAAPRRGAALRRRRSSSTSSRSTPTTPRRSSARSVRSRLLGARGRLADSRLDGRGHRGGAAGLAEELEMGFGKVAQPVRVAVTGSAVSPAAVRVDRDCSTATVCSRASTPRCRSPASTPRPTAEPGPRTDAGGCVAARGWRTVGFAADRASRYHPGRPSGVV
jgi:hypothetical protein